MNVQYSFGNNPSPWETMMVPLGLMVVYQFVLFAFLYRILTRGDFDTLNKILWVLVVVFVPLFGFVLYLTAAPKPVAKRFRIIPGSDVSGTPWADDPAYTKSS